MEKTPSLGLRRWFRGGDWKGKPAEGVEERGAVCGGSSRSSQTRKVGMWEGVGFERAMGLAGTGRAMGTGFAGDGVGLCGGDVRRRRVASLPSGRAERGIGRIRGGGVESDESEEVERKGSARGVRWRLRGDESLLVWV